MLSKKQGAGEASVQPEGGKKKPSRVKTLNIIGIIIIVLLIPVLVVNGTILYKSITNPDTPADFMGYIPLVAGDNITEFEANDLVIMKTVDASETLEEGAVICYLHNGKVVWQRILRTEVVDGQVSYVTKDDKVEENKANHVSPAQIVGVYHTHIDNVGSFVLFMQSRTGILTCVVLPIFVLFLVFYLIDRKRYHDALKDAQAAAVKNAAEEIK